jgi:hypothetical protein
MQHQPQLIALAGSDMELSQENKKTHTLSLHSFQASG